MPLKAGQVFQKNGLTVPPEVAGLRGPPAAPTTNFFASLALSASPFAILCRIAACTFSSSRSRESYHERLLGYSLLYVMPNRDISEPLY